MSLRSSILHLNDTKIDIEEDVRVSMIHSFYTNLSRKHHVSAKIEVKPLTTAQKKEVDEVYGEYFGMKVPYYDHELYQASSGKFDPFYIPEKFFFSDVECVLNSNFHYAQTIEDKNLFPLLPHMAGIKTPPIIWLNTDGMNFDKDREFVKRDKVLEMLADHDSVFVKPSVGTCGGESCKVFKDYSKDRDSLENVLNEIENTYKSNYLVQEVISNCDSLKEIHPWSINTFRIVTYILHGEIKNAPTALRTGRSQRIVDNGGVVTGVKDDGTLGNYCADKHFSIVSDVHPDTGYEFAGKKIDEFPLALEAAKKMHRHIPQAKIVHWDFTIDETGEPCLIEANISNGGIYLNQIANGCGPFTTDSEEIFTICKELRKYKKSQRSIPYATGNFWN